MYDYERYRQTDRQREAERETDRPTYIQRQKQMKREGERMIISAALHPYARYPTPLCYVPSAPSPRTGNREGKNKAGTKVTQLIMKNVEKHKQTERQR